MPITVAAAVPAMMGRSEPLERGSARNARYPASATTTTIVTPPAGAVAVNQEVDRRQHGPEGRRADDGEAPQMCSNRTGAAYATAGRLPDGRVRANVSQG